MNSIFGYIGEIFPGVWLSGDDSYTYQSNVRVLVRIFPNPEAVREAAGMKRDTVKVIPLMVGEAVPMSDPLDILRSLESKQNEGRGVSCVRSIISYLERGDLQSARAVADTDHDKIRNYPEVEDFLRKNL